MMQNDNGQWMYTLYRQTRQVVDILQWDTIAVNRQYIRMYEFA